MNPQPCPPAAAPLSKETLRAQVRRFLDEDPADDDNLMDFGLNSIAAMQLVAEWKAARLEVSFIELASRPTIDALWDLLKRRSVGAA
ncbi:hypothetical protein EZH22_22225 [Xanthobacter dioxanivorans]|uniref:Carrier domain-containing protein n=1 Tax=Xanthobacter dioxanivorans TaxID=2528964 RepID=A0A974PM58_9HYPH|nr:phosphopantetheine-binding protein [Xanthobacter dioxanivorans]QRG05731.1 hypothetical protein EZH22_22225 [Xanthobacter dioxanivorans]